MYLPLIQTCCHQGNFVQKIQDDFLLINSATIPISEMTLIYIHEKATTWLMKYSQENVLLVPGNLRAALQTFEGSEINDVKQLSTYVMQHHPKTILPDLLKLLSFAYRRGVLIFSNYNWNSDFAVAQFLKDLLLESTSNVLSLPFVVEFCLMNSFRVINEEGKERITMISCDTASSVFSKIFSVCKAGVCSVICSFKNDTFTEHGPSLISQIRESPAIHIMAPMMRQLREMHSRIPKRRKTTLDTKGNIIVDQYYFPYDIWTQIVPVSLDKLKACVSACSKNVWWEPIIDVNTPIIVKTDDVSGDLFVSVYNEDWNSVVDLDDLNAFGSIIEMTMHGFGGGSARFSELAKPTMLHVIWHNNTVYYKMESTKQFNHLSKRQKTIERKLPVAVARYYLLFRSLVRKETEKYQNSLFMIPKLKDFKDSQYTVRHVICDIFSLGSLPNMTQIRHFWAGITNFISKDRHLDSLTATPKEVNEIEHKISSDIDIFTRYIR
jgi:hypothetical protein